jgi:hypothetical protein
LISPRKTQLLIPESTHLSNKLSMINFSVTREKSYLKTIWNYENANYIAINQHLQNTDWDMKFGDSDNVNIIN